MASNAAFKVQDATGGSVAANSTTAVWGSNTTSGNLIVVVVGTTSTTVNSVTSITDSQGNAYTQLQTNETAGSLGDIEIWYAKNILGGTTPTITVNFNATLTSSVIAREYYGLDPVNPINQSNGSATGSNNAPTSNTVNTTNSPCLLVGVMGQVGITGTISLGTNWQNLNTNANGNEVAIEDQYVAYTGAYSATFNLTLSLQWECAIVAFNLAPHGTTTSTSSTSASTFSTSSTSSSISSTSSSISSTSTSASTSSTSQSTSSTSSSISSTSSSTSSTSVSSTSSSTSISSTSSSISSTSFSSTSLSSTSQSTSISSTSSSFSSTSSSISSTSHSTSSTSVSSTSSSSSTSTTLPPPNLSYSYQDFASSVASFAFTDAFSGASLNTTLWSDVSSTGGTTSVSGGLLTLTPAVNTANTSAEIASVNRYSLINSYVVIKIPTVGTQNSSTNFIVSYDANNEIFFYATGGVIGAEQEINGTFSSIGPNPTYNATTMAYWRIRETQGTTFFEYSSDGITWTSFLNFPDRFPMGSVQILLQLRDGSSDPAPGTAQIDSLNLVALPLVNSFTNPQYGNANVDDGDYFIGKGTQYLINQYKSKHQNNTDNIIFTWKGRSTESTLISPILIQIFNVSSGTWETLANITNQPADTDFQVTVSQTTNVSNYYDSTNTVTFRSYQQVI